MAQYRRIERPSKTWIAAAVIVYAAALTATWVLSCSWPALPAIMTMAASSFAAVVLLLGAWTSIKTREELSLLALSTDEPGDFEDALKGIGNEISREVFADLKREWQMNILGVLALLFAIGCFTLDMV